MSLKLMYITNDPEVARIAETAGVDRIFIDMEYIGKSKRQGGMDTVQSHHTVDDVKKIRSVITKSEVMVRVNPIHGATKEYGSSEDEINAVIDAGADLVMLPYFTSVEEVKRFVDIVNGRARVFPLFESKEALSKIDKILNIPGIDEAHIGLNDLSLDLGKKFMFELLTDGTVEYMCYKFRQQGIPYGFGGIGRLGMGAVPAEYIIKEHYRLGSTCAILSRSFCNTSVVTDMGEIKNIFVHGISEIRKLETECEKYRAFFQTNRDVVRQKIEEIARAK